MTKYMQYTLATYNKNPSLSRHYNTDLLTAGALLHAIGTVRMVTPVPDMKRVPCTIPLTLHELTMQYIQGAVGHMDSGIADNTLCLLYHVIGCVYESSARKPVLREALILKSAAELHDKITVLEHFMVKNQDITGIVFDDLSGKSGLGKRNAALSLAAFLLKCTEDELPRNRDFLLVDKGKESVKVEDVLNLLDQSSVTALGAVKIYLICHAEKINTQAQNKLLKLLEDRNRSNIVIFLCKRDMLLATIKSRCLTIEFLPLEDSEMEEYLKSHGIEDDRDFISYLCDNCPYRLEYVLFRIFGIIFPENKIFRKYHTTEYRKLGRRLIFRPNSFKRSDHMSQIAFSHLHSHTEYSLLNGSNRIQDYLDRVKELRMTSAAITDHGVMYGVVDFYKYAKKMGIHPVIGREVYVAPGDMKEKNGQTQRYYHLVLLAENNTGYEDLTRIVSLGFTKGFYYRPRVDFKTLEQYHEGLIALSASLAGELSKKLQQGNYKAACETAAKYKELFGPDNYYLELQDHGIPEQKSVNEQLVRMSRELGIPLVATNDAYYTRKEDAAAHDVLLCIPFPPYVMWGTVLLPKSCASGHRSPLAG